MREWEASDPDVGSAIRCPQCESSSIEYPQMTRKFLTPAIASVLFALKIFPKEFYCQDCQFTWSNGGDRRALSASGTFLSRRRARES